MLFNFKETYASRSNEELAQIVAHPDQYQPEAITAAKELLSERDVTEEALQDMIYPPQPEELPAGNAVQYEDGKTNIFEELQPRKRLLTIQPQLKLVYVLMGIYSFYRFILFIGELRLPLHLYSIPFVFLFFVSLDFIIPACCIILLCRYKKSGWVMATAYFSLSLLNMVIRLFSSNLPYSSSLELVLDKLLPMAGFVIILVQLYKVEIKAMFGIMHSHILLSVSITAVLFFGFLYLAS